MTVGRPILFFGPRPSHVSDLLDAHPIGTHVSHGDVDGAVAAILRLRDTPESVRRDMGRSAQQVLRATLSQSILCGRLCDATERALSLAPVARQDQPAVPTAAPVSTPVSAPSH
jgi:hypothetical protein